MKSISTKNKILAALLAVILLACVAGGIYANVQATAQRKECAEQTEIVDKYNQRWRDVEIESSIISSFKELQKTKADEAQAKADEAKSMMKKYGVFSAVLIFVAIMMAVCIVALLLPKKGLQVDDEPAEQLCERSTAADEKTLDTNDINALIDSFSIDAPKPSISEKED